MERRPRVTFPRRGEVYLVSFDPTVGSEIQRTRPALILQNDIANRHSPITIVAAMTSQFAEPLYPTEVLIAPPEGGLTTPSVVGAVLLGMEQTGLMPSADLREALMDAAAKAQPQDVIEKITG